MFPRFPRSTLFLWVVLATHVLLLTLYTSGELYKLTPNDSIQRALDKARPGDTLRLTEGTYKQDLQTVRSGTADNPITIEGSKKAKVIGSGHRHRIVEINHSYTTLRGFTVSGKRGNSGNSGKEDSSDYVDKCIFVLGTSSPEIKRASGMEYESSVDGIVIEDMEVEDCGGECIRLRSFVTNVEITGNRIERCGRHDYLFHGKGKNGEAIYVGTSSNQWNDGKNSKSGADKTKYVWIHDNVIDTQGNECVDVKEGATDVLVEYNVCSNQLDKNSGGFDSRADYVTFRYNEVSDCAGAGIRIGGHKIGGKTYGENNEVYGNILTNNAYASLKVETGKQHLFCQNICGKKGCTVRGDRADSVNGEPDASCSDSNLRKFEWLDHGRRVLREQEQEQEECYPLPLKQVTFSNSSQGAISADTRALTYWSTEVKGGWVSMQFGKEEATTAVVLRFADGDKYRYQFHLYGDGNPVLGKQVSSGNTLDAERFNLNNDGTTLSELTLFADSAPLFRITDLRVCGVNPGPSSPHLDLDLFYTSGDDDLDGKLGCTTSDLRVIDAVPRTVVDNLIGRDFSTAWTCHTVPCDVVLTLEQPSYVYQLDFSVVRGQRVTQDFDVQVLRNPDDSWEDVVTDQQSLQVRGTQSITIDADNVSKLKFIGYGSDYNNHEACALTTMNVVGCPM